MTYTKGQIVWRIVYAYVCNCYRRYANAVEVGTIVSHNICDIVIYLFIELHMKFS